MSKFHTYCSCITCRLELTIQNLNNHYQSNHIITGNCLYCNTALYNRNSKFCTRSCSAKYTNAKKDYSKIKTGPSKGRKYIPVYTKISQCVICKKFHPKSGKTCSNNCFSKHMSASLKGKTGGNRSCNIPGIDSFGKKFFYDSNWEIILGQSLTDAGILWSRPDKFILSNGRSYTPDFYIPDYNVFIDPKAKRPNYYRASILKIEMFEKEYNTKCLVISDKTLLSWGQIQTMMLVGNNRA